MLKTFLSRYQSQPCSSFITCLSHLSKQVVLTKADSLTPSVLPEVVNRTRAALLQLVTHHHGRPGPAPAPAPAPLLQPLVHVVSAKRGWGVPELKADAARLLKQREGQPRQAQGEAPARGQAQQGQAQQGQGQQGQGQGQGQGFAARRGGRWGGPPRPRPTG
jgi:hypothetical protein